MRDDLARQSPLAWGLLLALLGVAAWLWFVPAKGSAALATVASALGCAAILLIPRERAPWLPARVRALPRRLDFAPVLAAILSTPGYGLGWFHGANPFDEFVHLASGLLAGAVFAGLVLADGAPRGAGRVAWLGLLFGAPLAVGWEAFEWAVGIVGGVTDTASDIVLTAGGAALGAWAYAALFPQHGRAAAAAAGRAPA